MKKTTIIESSFARLGTVVSGRLQQIVRPGPGQVTVLYFKMPFRTKHFNENQKVWIQITTGAMAAKVAGKFRGKGKYVAAWVSWDKSDRDKYPLPKIKKIDIDETFAKRHKLQIKG